MKQDIKSMTLQELETALSELGEKKFRAGQVYSWLNRGAGSFEEMSNISKDLRQKLSEHFWLHAPRVAARQESRRD